MATRTWIGGATAIAQVWKGTITTTTTGHTYIVTLTDLNRAGTTVAFSYALVSADTTITLAAASWVTAWNASVLPLVSGITASSAAGVITLTADTAGAPFSAATSGTGTWASDGTTQASSGPYDYGLAANWAESAVPTTDDDVVLTGSNRISYNLNQSGAAIGNFSATGYSGTVGSQGTPLLIDPNGFRWQGTGTAYINIGSAAIAPYIVSTASGSSTAHGLHLSGSAMTTLTVATGSVGVAPSLGLTSTVATINNLNGTVYCGVGTTLTTYNHVGGTSTIGCAATTVTALAGTLTTEGVGAITTLNNRGATVNPNSTGTITTLNARGGTTDFSGSLAARTVTTLNLYKGAVVVRDPSVITVGTLTQSDSATITAD